MNPSMPNPNAELAAVSTLPVDTTQEHVRILLVEDEPMWQQAIQILLGSEPDFEVVSVSDTAESARAAFAEHRPHIVLLDWKLKDGDDGLEVGQEFLNAGMASHQMVLISGSDPGSIPPHPFLFVPKPRISSELLPLLVSVTKN